MAHDETCLEQHVVSYQIACGVIFSDAALIFLEGHIQGPVQIVFNAPMGTYGP